MAPLKIKTHPARIAIRDTRAVQPPPKTADPFYSSPAWRGLMTQLIAQRGRRCQQPQCSRAYDKQGKPIRVFGDHIVELRDGGGALDPTNIRLLCGACHTTKTIAARARRLSGP